MFRLLVSAAFILMGCAARAADNPLVLPVWPRATPGDSGIGQYGPIGPEHFRPPTDSPTKDAKWLTAVTNPTITVYRPPKETDTGAAMIVCPGGGYWNLAWDLEGEEVAEWLTRNGITGIILKYRVPRRKGEPERLPAPGPLMDAQRAISLVRSKAKEWGIDPNRIGIGGFSAGGHLAVAAATNYRERVYDAVDSADKESCRPDFAVGVYSGYFIVKETGVLSPFMFIPPKCPPIFLAHATDDNVSDVENSVAMYVALKRSGTPVELHLYSAGGHGWGVRKNGLPCNAWTDQCLAWLRTIGMIKAVSR